MGMNIQLQNERGETVGAAVADEHNVLPRLLTAANANKLAQLQHLDLYGDTTFNRSQLDAVADEWARLVPYAANEADRSFLAAVSGMIARGRESIHQYLKFIGD